MSLFQNPRPGQPFAPPSTLNRLLVLCRFDLRQKSWGLPAPVIRRDRYFKFYIPADAATLAMAVAKSIQDFSDPALGGTNPSNTASGRIAFRSSLPRFLGKTKQPKERKHET
jgi:hypothetical protein